MQLNISSVTALQDKDGKNCRLIGGKLEGESQYLKLLPCYVKTLGFSFDKPVIVGDAIDIEEGEIGPFSYYLPQGHDGWPFLGSNYLSVYFIFGLKENVLSAVGSIEDHVKKTIPTISEEYVMDHGFTYAIWEFDDEYSMLAVYTERESPLDILDVVYKKDLLIVQAGAHAGDLLAHEIVFPQLVSEFSSIASDIELSEETLDLFEEFDDAGDYSLTYNSIRNSKVSVPKNILIDFSQRLLLDIMNYEFDDEELKERLKKLSV